MRPTDPTLPAQIEAPSSRSVLPDRYVDKGRIGRGGMAEVRRVADQELGINLAMKLMFWSQASDPEARAKFLDEARLTAQLVHPGVVSVHNLGELDDGRPWYTMTEVRGQTFAEFMDVGPPLRRAMEVFHRVCETLAFAHANDVIHRDLKPENIMIGPFGEVWVMDWGLGQRLTDSFARRREMVGTPGWMAPEQATDEAVGPASDVFALGSLLYRILAGKAPYEGPQVAAFQSLREGPPPSVRDAAAQAPADLLDLCEWAMKRESSKRPTDAAVLATRVREWLEGARKRTDALRLMQQADALVPKIQELRHQSEALRRAARARLANLRDHDPVDLKRVAWAEQDQAELLEVQVEVQETRWLQTLRASLAQVEELPEVHARLATHYGHQLLRAEHDNQRGAAAKYEALLQHHDRGESAALLTGLGRLDLLTSPPGATATLYRYETRDRRLIPQRVETLGETPLIGVSLPHGSYLLLLEKEGYQPVRYPVYLERGGHWGGVPPEGSEPEPVWLPPAGLLDSGWCYVPAGWFRCGGDADAIDAGPSRSLWVDGFALRRDPTTEAEYLAFLEELGDDAVEHVPGGSESGIYSRENGVWRLGRDPSGYALEPDLPVVRVSWGSAILFAETVYGGSLPTGVQWEKAARGVDGRRFPMGNFLDPTWAVLASSRPESPRRQTTTRQAQDVSPYLVRGMAGNVRDWCLDPWRHEGEQTDERHIPNPQPEHPGVREVRGACYTSGRRSSRCASRTAAPPSSRLSIVGFRPALSVLALRSPGREPADSPFGPARKRPDHQRTAGRSDPRT